MNSKFGNAEMHYIPLNEIHMPHTWRCCWRRTIVQAFYMLAIGSGIVLLFWLLLVINGQIAANLSI